LYLKTLCCSGFVGDEERGDSVGLLRGDERLISVLLLAAIAGAVIAPISLAAGREAHEIPVSASFVSLTYYEAPDCISGFGVEYANIRGATSYSIEYAVQPIGVQKWPKEEPNLPLDAALWKAKTSVAKKTHYFQLSGSGSDINNASLCKYAAYPMAKDYSHLKVVATVP
jgi:hypothetical protein